MRHPRIPPAEGEKHGDTSCSPASREAKMDESHRSLVLSSSATLEHPSVVRLRPTDCHLALRLATEDPRLDRD